MRSPAGGQRLKRHTLFPRVEWRLFESPPPRHPLCVPALHVSRSAIDVRWHLLLKTVVRSLFFLNYSINLILCDPHTLGVLLFCCCDSLHIDTINQLQKTHERFLSLMIRVSWQDCIWNELSGFCNWWSRPGLLRMSWSRCQAGMYLCKPICNRWKLADLSDNESQKDPVNVKQTQQTE